MPSVADERVTDAHYDDASLIVDLAGVRTISLPRLLDLRLLHATTKQRGKWELSGWDEKRVLRLRSARTDLGSSRQ